MSSIKDTLRAALRPPLRVAMDAADDGGAGLPGAAEYAETNIALLSVAAVQQWAETSDLDSGESYADRLMALMIGVADQNKDGELSDDEQDVINVALETAWDYLAQAGADEDDISALLNDWDADAADRVRELVAAAMPEGDDAAVAEIDSFVFGSGDQKPALDAAGEYKTVTVIRGGKKARIKKRLSAAPARRSAKQKLAIRKASMKAHSATAQMHRMKSMRVRKKVGL